MYKITNYTYKRAKKLGVKVKPSTNKTKKIDVFKAFPVTGKLSALKTQRFLSFKNNVKIASVGANGMSDYPTYIQNRGMKFAKTRRRLYRKRHEKDRHVKGTPGYYADKLLW